MMHPDRFDQNYHLYYGQGHISRKTRHSKR